MRSARHASRRSSRRAISGWAKPSPATSASAGPRHSASASASVSAASSGSPRASSLAAAAVGVLEAVGVERDAHAVAARLRDQGVLADRGAQPRCHDLHGVAGVLRALALPQLVDDPPERDDRATVDEQQGEQRERPPARDAGGPAVAQPDLDRPEDPDLADHRSSEPIRAQAQVKAIRQRDRVSLRT